MSDSAQGSRVYLDHAATSWPKPEGVIEAISSFMRDCGASAGRGTYRSAMQASEVVHQTRRLLAKLIGAEDDACVSLHSSGTAALNAAIHGLIGPGDHVVTTAAEHNSVLRPLHFLQQTQNIRLDIVPVDEDGRVDAEKLLEFVRPKTRMVAVTGASNVTGAVQPITEIGAALRDRDTVFLCDAAQTFGLIPIDVQTQSIDLLVAPGHKGSHGPPGTAMLSVGRSLHDQIRPTIQGGTGSISESLAMPTQMPQKLEPGTSNVALLAGWNVALQGLVEVDFLEKQASLTQLAKQMQEGIRGIHGIRVFGKAVDLPIISLSMESLSPTDLAMVLDQEYRIETRAGYHCAASIHQHLHSQDDGTLRVSAGPETTEEEIHHVISAFQNISSAMQPDQ